MCKIPEPPERILDAMDNNTLVLFIGAGVSRLSDYPSWSELPSKLIKKLYEKNKINYETC